MGWESLPFLFGLIGGVHLELYRDQPERARRELDDTREMVDASVLHRVPFVRVELAQLRAHVALACAARASGPDRSALVRAARRDTAWLARQRMPYARACAAVLAAAAARLDGDQASAIAALRTALTWFETSHSGLHAAATRHRLGDLLGGRDGGDLLATAAADFAAREVANPTAMTRLFTP